MSTATIYNGSCSCESIKIQVNGDPLFSGLCHCHSCQKATGSTHSTNWVVPKPAFTIIAGQATTYEAKGGSGKPVLRKFCGICSSTMWTESSRFPDIIVVKAGILDGGAMGKFTPKTEAYTARRPGWLKDIEGATQFEEAFKAE